MVKCPLCDKGELKKGKVKETMFGVFLGEFPADISSSCGDSFTDEKTTQLIQKIAKKKIEKSYATTTSFFAIILFHANPRTTRYVT